MDTLNWTTKRSVVRQTGKRQGANWEGVTMAPSAKKVKRAKKKAKKKSGSFVVPPNVMKLITLLTLLVSDADILFTIFSLVQYVQNEVPDPTPDNPDNMKPEPLIISTAIVGLFSLLYLGGCIIAAREAKLFVYRFREKVRLNEIAGLDLEDMDHFFNGLPVALPVQRSLQEQEKEFRDKAQGDGERTSRAERAGHASRTGKLEREKSGLSGGADQSPAARSRSPVAQPPPNTVTLAKTVEQSKKVYADDPVRGGLCWVEPSHCPLSWTHLVWLSLGSRASIHRGRSAPCLVGARPVPPVHAQGHHICLLPRAPCLLSARRRGSHNACICSYVHYVCASIQCTK